MINKLIETLELMNKLKGFKKFSIDFEPQEVKRLYKELIALQKKLEFMIDKNDEKQERIDKVIEYIDNCPVYLWSNVNTRVLKDIIEGDKNE